MVVLHFRDGWSKAGGAWTDELVGYALDRFHRRNLRTPTVTELRAGVPGLPSHSTVRRLYGNASGMLRAHGYAVRKAGGQPGHACWGMLRDDRGLFVSRSAASHESTAAAHRRPSLIAQTISD
jgi:hypothetical protein